ncbi:MULTISPECIES: hypothetical protein [unclassified Microcoleus]|uniref:hypothetical protein n=1 Tax=unclassified Microcoleus TaxID=2642155 RepID=UPI002FD38506
MKLAPEFIRGVNASIENRKSKIENRKSKIENRLTFLAKNMKRQAAENPNGGLTHYRAEDLMHNPVNDSRRQGHRT